MNGSKTRAYRVAVAVAFGLVGFGVNFLDVEFMKGAAFKISILAGLFFPLVVALAWGWRYGLLSALAGGCQTMWWLWYGDGWGILYSVPVFTLWIVWHGWWAERRSEGHPWYVSSFAVEIPFRIVIELGFLVVFRWLVSLNPPPWNPAISWDHVSSAWLQTVAVKHVVEAYILLMSAYVTLSLGPVRRFFGLPSRTAQRDTTAIYLGAALFGLLLWALGALVDYFVFPHQGQTFWDTVVHGASGHAVFNRSVYVATALLAGIVLARLNRSRAGLQELLEHRNRILAAIRNVNQLVVREKDPDRLLDEACRLLVETRGYYNAWIVLMADGRPREPFFHAGFNGGFAPMTDRLRAGDLPICARAALSSGSVQVMDDPPAQCGDCPLSSSSAGRAGLALRLEHAGRVLGWMSLSCPARFARRAEDHDLMKEVAGDIAFALWAIETEARGETLARKYAAVLAATSDAVMAGDLDGRITVFNPGAEKMFGCTAEEALGTPIVRFCPEDRLAEQAEMLRRVRDEGAVAGYETERLTADGRRVPVEITLGLNTDEQGRPLGINAILRDITERKRAEHDLEASETRYRRLFESAKDGILILEADTGIIVDINPFMLDLLGYPYEAFVGKHLWDIGEFKDTAISQASFRELQTKNYIRYEDLPLQTRDGRRIDVEFVSNVYRVDNQKVIQCNIRSIAERKRAEEALRSSERFLRSTLDGLSAHIAVLDDQGEIILTNKAYRDFGRRNGVDPGAVSEGTNYLAVCDTASDDKSEEAHPFAEGIRAVLSGKRQSFELEYPCHSPDEKRWFVGRVTPFTGEGPRRVIVAHENITERMGAEAEREKIEAQLRQAQKMEAIGTLAGGIAHDFNNILSPIMLHAEMLMMDLPEDSPGQTNLKQIYRCGERARDLVGQILAFARKKEEDRIPLKASLIVKECLKFLRSTLPSTIDIHRDLRTDRDTVLADPTQLNQIVMNLCINAAHAMEDAGGLIEIVLENDAVDAESDNRLPGLDPGDYVRLTVRDTGSGIEPDILDRIFDPYFTTKPPGKGTGMGLALVHGIVKSWGGTITVESEPGRGTRFDVRLPLVGDVIEALDHGKEREPLPGGSERVLLVDDEPWAVDAVRIMLERLGYRVTARTSSIEALEAFRDHPQNVDLVITDMTMPNMTGKELTRQLMAVRPDMPVILCTGFSETIDERRAKEIGIRAFVMKPIVMSRIAKTIREVLDRK